MTDTRRSVVERALETAVGVGTSDLGDLFTEDVNGWSPNLAVTSRAELEREYAERDEAFSNVVIEFLGFDLVDSKAIVEWVIGADHTGPFVIDDITVDPTGRRLVLAGATFAEFRGSLISAFRNYFDDAALLEQLLTGE
jgi:hypothetical protein